jgi:hypothetical protein
MDLAPPGPYPPGATDVVLTITDDEGEVRDCQTTIIAEDGTPPAAVCKDVTVSLDEFGEAILSPEQVDGGSYDNCSIRSRSVSPPIFSCAEAGPNLVTFTVMDASFQIDQCTATVTVVDDSPPAFVCPTSVTEVAGPQGTVTIPDFLSGLAASDNCTPSSEVLVVQDPPAGATAEVGATTVTITAGDSAGNISSCTVAFTVLAPTPTPTLTPTPTATQSPTPTRTSTATPSPTVCFHSADQNTDGRVDASDLIEILKQWRERASSTRSDGDLNCDGKLDSWDILLFQEEWE